MQDGLKPVNVEFYMRWMNLEWIINHIKKNFPKGVWKIEITTIKTEINALPIDAKDIYFVDIAITINIKAAIIPATGVINNSIPNEVATAFPPLKFKNIGNIWPKTATRPNRGNILISNIWYKSFKSKIKRMDIIIIPFKTSNTSAKNPNLTPRTLVVFVAPVLLEPSFLISVFLTCLTSKYPLGIDPQ